MPDSAVTWRVLRSPTAETSDGPVELTARARAVLWALLLHANEVVPTDHLVDLVWGDRPPATARNSIARFVADLRAALGPRRDRIATAPGGYRVIIRQGELDWDEARRALDCARENVAVDHERCRLALVRSLDLLGRSPSPPPVDHPDAFVAIRVHDEARVEAIDRFAELLLHDGQHREVIAFLEQAVDTYPYHERLWAHLMVALHRSNRTTEAMRTYQRLSSILAEVGIVPSPALRHLELGLVDGDLLARPSPNHQPATTAARHHGIVEPTTALVERADEVAAVQDAILAHRLVSAVGTAGVGKTRVALAAVGAFDRSLTDPGIGTVHRIKLQPLDDAARIVTTIAAVMGIPASVGVDDANSLADALGSMPALLLLDGVDHLADACRDVAEVLVAHAPGVRIVVTCRRPLRAAAEHVVVVEPLAVDVTDVDVASPALALFLERADIDDVSLEPVDRAHAETICRSLGGLPLALELAASHLGPATLAEVAEGLAAVDGVPVASALAAAIDQTWMALTPGAQALLARASVFVDGWTAAAADDVCSERRSIRGDLAELTQRGLVTVSGAEDARRFQLCEPVRTFAADRLAERGETAVVRGRLVLWLRSLTDGFGVAELHAWAEASAALAPEHGNLAAALVHLSDSGRSEELAWLAVRSTGLWINHGEPGEVQRWLGPLAEDAALSDEARCAIAAMLMESCHARGDLTALATWGMTSLDLAGDRPYDWLPAVAGFLGVWSRVYPVPRATEELIELAGSLAERSPSRDTNLALAAMYRGHLAFGQRRYDEAGVCFAEGRTLTSHPGRLLLLCEVGEGLSLSMAGRHDDAVVAVEAWRSRDDTDVWHYVVDVARAIILGAAGRPDHATSELAAAVRHLPSANVWGRADDLQMAFGLLADQRGEHELAEELLATPITRHLLLATVIVEHVAAKRGLHDDAELIGVALELWSRVFPDGVRRGDATNTPELVAWWTSGDASTPATEP